MILFRDFAPKIIDRGGAFKNAEFEELHEAVAAANQWVDERAVEVVNIETVVLPAIHNIAEEGTTDPDLLVRGGNNVSWHQFVRVWFRAQQ